MTRNAPHAHLPTLVLVRPRRILTPTSELVLFCDLLPCDLLYCTVLHLSNLATTPSSFLGPPLHHNHVGNRPRTPASPARQAQASTRRKLRRRSHHISRRKTTQIPFHHHYHHHHLTRREAATHHRPCRTIGNWSYTPTSTIRRASNRLPGPDNTSRQR